MKHIAIAQSDSEIERCLPVMRELRPHLTDDTFVARVRQQESLGGFNLVYLEDAGEVKAVAGIPIMENLAWGKFLYVDDLVTAAAERSKGYGDALFDWLVGYARQQECQQLHLDSGVQRFDAHRFYLRKRMSINCHHFALPLS
ncbi:MAG: GNAT family N-acetyltransferase [Abitibacteriaceae bacterium]|nr:GNAT family N-acetyltransferase [Abditibacteriaceae bacterium]MBV9867068.1 GNAT family N-acetyltransferase [Abditibacteriaceae bacterium]